MSSVPKNAPLPGKAVRGSLTGRPIMASFDLLGRRWVLRIVCELHDGPLSFNEIWRRADKMSTSVLSTRLRELASAKLVEHDPDGTYQLTDLGRSLTIALEPMFRWSDEWAEAIGSSPNSPHGLRLG